MSLGNLLVKDSCLNCKHLCEKIEFGKCECDNDYAKGVSQTEVDELVRRGRTGKLQEIRKPYKMVDVEIPLKRVLAMAERLAEESSVLASVSKSICEKEQRRNRAIKVKKVKGKVKSTVSNMERSKADLEQGKKKSLKKSDDLLTIGVLDGSIKSGEIQGWIEKRVRG